MSAWKQIRAILLLPGVVTIAIPAIILYPNGIVWRSYPWNIVLPVLGFILVVLGLTVMIWTNRLFITIGHGTLAPWDPPQKFVVRGVYRYVRNPMITGVFCILLGEALFFGSLPLLGWFAFAVAVN